MVHDADGEHKVKGFGQQWQLFQVCLKEADIGQLLAERGGFIDGAGVICGGDMSACGAAEQCIATAPAAGIKDMEVAERLGCDAGFGEKGLLIFCFVSDVEVCPLESEAIEVLIADEAWDAILNGGDDSAIGRAECGGISVGCERLSGTRCVPLSRLWVAVLGLFLGRHVGYLLNSGVRSLAGNSHLRVVGLASGVWVLLGDLSEFRVFV